MLRLTLLSLTCFSLLMTLSGCTTMTVADQLEQSQRLDHQTRYHVEKQWGGFRVTIFQQHPNASMNLAVEAQLVHAVERVAQLAAAEADRSVQAYDRHDLRIQYIPANQGYPAHWLAEKRFYWQP